MSKHPHADILIARSEGKTIEFQSSGCDPQGGRWHDMCHAHPEVTSELFSGGHRYRYRVRAETIQVNGVSVPEPLRKAPPVGTPVFTVSPSSEKGYVPGFWNTTDYHERALALGLVHASATNAACHAAAMVRSSRDWAKL